MKFNPKHISKIMMIPSILSLFGLDGIFNEVHGFVLDNIEKKDRTFCKAPERERRGITPLKESIERGECESTICKFRFYRNDMHDAVRLRTSRDSFEADATIRESG